MVLSDRRIRNLLELSREEVINKKERLDISPIKDHQIQPASIDLTLSNEFAYYEAFRVVTLNEEQKLKKIKAKTYDVNPHSFVLATTAERVKIPHNITGFVEGRSSIGRLGLFIQNAGLIDAGFNGQITLELFNASDNVIRIDAGRRICQLVLMQMESNCINPYSGKYQNQVGATPSMIKKDRELLTK